MGQVRIKTPDRNSKPTIETKPLSSKVISNQEHIYNKHESSHMLKQ
jgi:hypothetical protein